MKRIPAECTVTIIMSYLLRRNYGNNEMFWWVWKSISGFSPGAGEEPLILRSCQLSRNQAWHQLNGIITVKITGIGLLRRDDEMRWEVDGIIKFNSHQNFTENLLLIEHLCVKGPFIFPARGGSLSQKFGIFSSSSSRQEAQTVGSVS